MVSNARAAPLRGLVFEMKREQAHATGARHFVTSCGPWRITLEQGAKRTAWNHTPESLLELVADHLAD